MRRIIGAAALVVAGAIAATPALASEEPKVALCHATGSQSNPFVLIEVDAAGAFDGHYTEHEGDVIPPFVYDDPNDDPDLGAVSYALNWDLEGQALFANDCELADESPTPTPSPSPSESPTPSETPAPSPSEGGSSTNGSRTPPAFGPTTAITGGDVSPWLIVGAVAFLVLGTSLLRFSSRSRG